LKKKISVAILCGGKSSRFGKDKTKVPFRGKQIYRILWDKLSPKTDDSFLQLKSEDDYGLPSKYDLPAVSGPLGGIYSALVHSRYEWTFVSACDLPLLDPRIVDELAERIDGGAKTVIPRWDNGYWEPLAALYHASLSRRIKRALDGDVYKIMDFVDGIDGVRTVRIEGLISDGNISKQCFCNVNTRKDLDRLRR